MTAALERAADALPDVDELLDDDAHPVERLDVAVARAATTVKDTPVVKALGWASEVADQPQLSAICAATWAYGAWVGDRRLARAGARMFAAWALATLAKMAIKARVDRTRPFVIAEEGRYETGTEGINEGKHNSFPSGHTAGAVAVARAVARAYPEHAAPAYGAAGAVALIQVPRCAHYPSDIGAGAAIGWAAEWLVSRALPAPAPPARPVQTG